MRATIIVISAALLAVAAVAGAARATPSTLVWIPATDVQAPRTYHLGIDNYFPPSAGESAPTDVGLTYGGEGWEAGVDYFGGTNDPLQFNAKIQLVRPERYPVTVAAGVYGVGTDRDATAYNIVYALASKTFAGTRAHLGYFRGRRSLLGSDNSGLLAGVDRALSDRWWAAIDYQGGDSSFGATSVGVSYAFAPNVSLIVGWVDLHHPDSDDSITTQLDINF